MFLITGCSAGIGIETGRAVAATGARVFLAVRSLERGQKACESFLEPGRVELLRCDTSSLASVRQAASEFLSRSRGLNVLICNAGIMRLPTREESPDGFELQLATNYLGHFLLFWLLRDAMLEASTPDFNSRLVNVSSTAMRRGRIDFDDFNLAQDGAYNPMRGYSQSKLAQVYQANYVDRHFGPKGLHALSLNPGGIFTNLTRHVPQDILDMWAKDSSTKNPEQGAATTLVAALSKEWEGQGGKFLDHCAVVAPESVPPYDEVEEGKLWHKTLEVLGLQEQRERPI